MSPFWVHVGIVMGAWAVVATFVNAKVKAPTAPKWKVIAYHLLVDTPALWASIGKTGILGKLNLPGLPSFTVDDKIAGLPLPKGPAALLPLLLIPALFAAGCAGLKAQAKADGISEARLVLQDIAKDAPEVGSCVFKTAATVGAVYAGDLSALATGAVQDIACFYDAVKEIISQLSSPNATPPSPTALMTANSAHKLIKAALSVQQH